MKKTAHGYPQTGQTTCHDPSGVTVSCTGSGQDGEFRRGIPWPEPRFEIRGEIVLDRLTGLYWMRNATPGELPITWREALAFVAGMNRERALGFSGWRLPNRRELCSLVSHQTRRPALPEGHPFINVFAGWYWSATSAAGAPAHAWYVDMDGGRMFYGGKDQSFLVWPVRKPHAAGHQPDAVLRRQGRNHSVYGNGPGRRIPHRAVLARAALFRSG